MDQRANQEGKVVDSTIWSGSFCAAGAAARGKAPAPIGAPIVRGWPPVSPTLGLGHQGDSLR